MKILLCRIFLVLLCFVILSGCGKTIEIISEDTSITFQEQYIKDNGNLSVSIELHNLKKNQVINVGVEFLNEKLIRVMGSQQSCSPKMLHYNITETIISPLAYS